MRAEAIQLTRSAPRVSARVASMTNQQNMYAARYASDFTSTLELR